jgi:peptidoglycan/LPS O-acetylase OafA/YrhL
MAATLILVPALLGAVFEWPRYLTYALLVPGFSLEIAFGWAAARARGAEYRKARPSRGVMALVGGFCGLLGALTAGLDKTYAPLLFALLLIVVAEPWSRVVWKRHRNAVQ